jgi:hypothetical protein
VIRGRSPPAPNEAAADRVQAPAADIARRECFRPAGVIGRAVRPRLLCHERNRSRLGRSDDRYARKAAAREALTIVSDGIDHCDRFEAFDGRARGNWPRRCPMLYEHRLSGGVLQFAPARPLVARQLASEGLSLVSRASRSMLGWRREVGLVLLSNAKSGRHRARRTTAVHPLG